VADAALDDSLDPEAHPRLASILRFVAKLTRDPGGVKAADLDPLRLSNVSDDAILDAVAVCAGFSMIVRVADALAFAPPDPEELRKGARFLLSFGYTAASGVWLRMPRRYHGSKTQQYQTAFNDLRRSIWESAGSLPPAVRRSASAGTGVPEPLLGYARTVLRNALEVSDADIDLLQRAGYTEDQIFEATVSAAFGAAVIRRDAGMAALGKSWHGQPA
jgi:alkylhydroperoxidase family enzyme